jgi:hypothetical protein
MWIAVISALVCFAIATILFTPPLRGYPFYQALSFYFLFEGGWTVLNAVVQLIWPGSTFMDWVHYIGAILLGGYLFYRLFSYYWSQKSGKEASSLVKKDPAQPGNDGGDGQKS